MTIDRVIDILQQAVKSGEAKGDDQLLVSIPGSDGVTAGIVAFCEQPVRLDEKANHPGAMLTFCRRKAEVSRFDTHADYKGASI